MRCDIYNGVWYNLIRFAVREDGLVFKYDHKQLRWVESDRTAESVRRVLELVAKNVVFKQA